MGFNQAAERFIIVDVGSGKEAADAKIKGKTPRCNFACEFQVSILISDPLALLEDEIRLPQTEKIIFGGQ